MYARKWVCGQQHTSSFHSCNITPISCLTTIFVYAYSHSSLCQVHLCPSPRDRQQQLVNLYSQVTQRVHINQQHTPTILPHSFPKMVILVQQLASHYFGHQRMLQLHSMVGVKHNLQISLLMGIKKTLSQVSTCCLRIVALIVKALQLLMLSDSCLHDTVLS